MKQLKWTLLFGMVFLQCGFAQQKLELWPHGIPNSKPSHEKEIIKKKNITFIKNIQKPTIEVFLPSKRNMSGQAVLICPGGGYVGEAYDYTGTDIAKFLNGMGVAGIVLKYRLPNSASVKVGYKAPLQDARRAMKLIRKHATSWNIDPNKIGVIGFSAGGHVASTLGTHFKEKAPVDDSISKLNGRPDFMALIFPVISMRKGIAHMGSRNALLGKNPSKKLIDEYSNELQVTKATPPTFLVQAEDDPAVPVENSLLFYKALHDKGISAEMHLYPKGGHGFSLAIGKEHLRSWTDRLRDWLQYIDKK